MKDILAIVDLHNSGTNDPLTENRQLASTTFLGRYAFIDFILSDLIANGIDDISILVEKNYRSITKHLGPSSTYLKNTKIGAINVLINEKYFAQPSFNTDVHNLLENDYILYDTTAKYALICPVNVLYRINFQEALKEHIASGKKISVIYKATDEIEDYLGQDKIVVDALGNAQKFEKVTEKDEIANVSLNTYILDMDYLKNVVLKSKSLSDLFTLSDIFKYLSHYEEDMHCIEFKGYARVVNSIKSYYKYSFEILDRKNESHEILNDRILVLTTTHNSRPVLYGENADVTCSSIANGSTINGKVKHSILARDVVIEEGATVEDSILFTHTIVRKGVHLKGVIADKRCEFKTKSEVIAPTDDPIYIPRGEII